MKTGTSQSKAARKARASKAFRAYVRSIERESIIDQMAEAMRSADLEYVAEYARFTTNVDLAWYRFVEFAKRAVNEG